MPRLPVEGREWEDGSENMVVGEERERERERDRQRANREKMKQGNLTTNGEWVTKKLKVRCIVC